MPLDASIISRIRDEIGSDTDFSDDVPHLAPQLDSLEAVYEDDERGASSILRTAWVVWKRRLAEMQQRAFDITTEGSLLNRSQKVKYMERRIHELGSIVGVDETQTGRNMVVQAPVAAEEDAIIYGALYGSSEF